MKFSIIIVSYNSGKKLEETVRSCMAQVGAEYEVIIKDGESTDGSLDFYYESDDKNIKLISCKDQGIYDAMNQAVKYVTGDYVIYMNCGDFFYNPFVLEKVQIYIEKKQNQDVDIFYGDCYVRSRSGIVRLPEQWNEYSCYRYTICHQSMFYKTEFLRKFPFDIKCNICACIVHYIYAYARDKRKLEHIPIVVANYEGGGVSDTSEGRKESLQNQNIALKKCFGVKHYYYKAKMLLSGQLIKQWICTLPLFYKIYEKIAVWVYSRRKND